MGPPHECDGMLSANCRSAMSADELQWGRRTNATECGSRRLELRGARASMGPPHECDGMKLPPSTRSPTATLQWGRRNNATEWSYHRAQGARRPRFNGAAARMRRNVIGQKYSGWLTSSFIGA